MDTGEKMQEQLCDGLALHTGQGVGEMSNSQFFRATETGVTRRQCGPLSLVPSHHRRNIKCDATSRAQREDWAPSLNMSFDKRVKAWGRGCGPLSSSATF